MCIGRYSNPSATRHRYSRCHGRRRTGCSCNYSFEPKIISMASVSLITENVHLQTKKHIQADDLEVVEAGKSLKVHTDKPHLVSLGGGRLSTAVTLFPISEGRTYVGTEYAPTTPDVVIQGTGVEAQHCFIENMNGVVTIHPMAEQTAVDGIRINKPSRLVQGSTICLGRSTYFRFNHPQEAEMMKRIMPNLRISVTPINFTPEREHNSLPNSSLPLNKNDALPPHTDLEGEDFMKKVSKFEFLAHSNAVSPTEHQHWFVRDGIRSSSASDTSSVHSYRQENHAKKTPNYSKSPPPVAPKPTGGAKGGKILSVTKLDPHISPKVFLPTTPAAKVANTEKNRVLSCQNVMGKRRSSLEELQVCQQQHQKVVEERIREQQLEKQEQMRLEEILNICAEYERQTRRDKPNDTDTQQPNTHNNELPTSLHAKSPAPSPVSPHLHINRIKTNGSLPRDRTKSPVIDPAASSTRKPVKSTSSEDELNRIFNFDSPSFAVVSPSDSSSGSEKKPLVYSTYPQSPRTRIKTVVNKERFESSLEKYSVIANKAAIESADEVFLGETRFKKQQREFNMSTGLIQEETAILRQQKNMVTREITSIRHQTLDLDNQEDDVISELEIEYALLGGEHQNLLDKNRCDEELLSTLRQRELQVNREMEFARENEHHNNSAARIRLEEIEEILRKLECNLDGQPEGSPERDQLLTQIKLQHEIVETERKLFEDLEFQQLEHDAHREEEREQIVRELMALEEQIQKRRIEIHEIEVQKEEVTNQVKQERQIALSERQKLANLLKKERDKLATVDTKLKALTALDNTSHCDSDQSSQSSDEGEIEISAKSPTLLSHERKNFPVQNGGKNLQKRGGLVFEEEAINNVNTNSFSSFDSGTSSGASSDVQSDSLSSEELLEKSFIDDDPQLAVLWDKMQRKEERKNSLLDECTPLCSGQGSGIKHRENVSYQQRPLTRYLPVRSGDFNLKQHIESAGHQLDMCQQIHVSRSACRGFLYKLGTKFRTWNKRWFVFDRSQHTLFYYSDKSETSLRGCIYFQRILEVYVDHLHSVRSPNPKLTFCVKTLDRPFYLVAPGPEAMRIWIDVIFTGAEGYREFQVDT